MVSFKEVKDAVLGAETKDKPRYLRGQFACGGMDLLGYRIQHFDRKRV
jgi:hypothetical protein